MSCNFIVQKFHDSFLKSLDNFVKCFLIHMELVEWTKQSSGFHVRLGVTFK